MSRSARPSDVDEICAALPATEFGTSWGDVPTWKVPAGDAGRGFLMYRRAHSSAVDPGTGEPYDDLLVVVTAGPGEKQELLDADSPFFTVPHFDRTNAVLVRQSRLGEMDLDELREVITDAWAARAPKKLVKEFFADG